MTSYLAVRESSKRSVCPLQDVGCYPILLSVTHADGQRGAEGETRNKAGGKDPGEMAMSVSIAYSLGLVT
jgi:hypothetical protein